MKIVRQGLGVSAITGFLLTAACKGSYEPKRAAGIPTDAVWAGGADGGRWISCDVKNSEATRYYCRVFNDFNGSEMRSGDYVLKKVRWDDDQKKAFYSDVETFQGPLKYNGDDGRAIHLLDSLVLLPVEKAFESASEKSGKVLLHFKGFEYGKEWNARFEIVNDSGHPFLYVGSNRRGSDDYCTLAAKRQEQFTQMSFRVRDGCYHGTADRLQTVRPGESIIRSVGEHEVRGMLRMEDGTLSPPEITAQIGFEVFIGDENRREILWSDQITFPKDPSN